MNDIFNYLKIFVQIGWGTLCIPVAIVTSIIWLIVNNKPKNEKKLWRRLIIIVFLLELGIFFAEDWSEALFVDHDMLISLIFYQGVVVSVLSFILFELPREKKLLSRILFLLILITEAGYVYFSHVYFRFLYDGILSAVIWAMVLLLLLYIGIKRALTLNSPFGWLPFVLFPLFVYSGPIWVTRFVYSYGIIPTVIIISIITLVVQLTTRPKTSVWWLLFTIISASVFQFIVWAEIYLLENSDELVTSSGDVTYRMNVISRIIGYAIMIGIFVLIVSILKKKVKITKWIILPLVAAFCFIYYKNSECVVESTAGGGYYHLHFPFEETRIGGPVLSRYPKEDWSKLTPSQDSMAIKSWEKKGGKIIFHRNVGGDYVVRDWFLFWKLDSYQSRYFYLGDTL